MLKVENVLSSQKNLPDLCAERQLKTHEIFFGNTFYGMDFILKKYVDFPEKYPLKALLVHGPILSNNYIWQVEVESHLPTIYCYPSHREHIYINHGNNKYEKLIIPAASPFLYALEILKKEPKPKRSGTIFFPTHSSGYVTAEMDFEKLAEELLQLDSQFQPVTVCLYWKDFNLGRYLPFQKRGLKVVSAGHVFDPYFLFRFYHLCSTHRYAAGNDIGTHIFYSVKSGCSYFHLDSSVRTTYTAPNEALLKHDVADVPPDRELALKLLFSVPQPETTPAQMAMVDYYLGTKNLKTKSELQQELLEAEIRYTISSKTSNIYPVQQSIIKRINRHQPNNILTGNELTSTNTQQYPLVSICVPTFNGEKFIIEALGSILAQSYPALEIIISDDNSQDRTIELAKLILEKNQINFRIITHEQYGLSQNWNFCISQAKGKYIKFLFQDDILAPNCIEEMVYLAEQDEEIGLVFSPRQLFTNPEDAKSSPNLLENHEAKDIHKYWSKLQPIQSGQELLQDANILDNPINKIGEPSIVLIKKEVFDKVGLFNSDLCQLVDLEMWLRIMSQYKIGYVNQSLSRFRIHPQQQTRRNTALKDAILLDYHKFFYSIANNSNYPQLTRQKAACRYAILTANYPQLQQLRTTITIQLLEIPDHQISEIYATLLGNIYKTLLHSGIQNQQLTLEEQTFINEILDNNSQNPQPPKTINHLLISMLYRNFQQFVPINFTQIPQWLLSDYIKVLLSSQEYFQNPGEAEKYYQYINNIINNFYQQRLQIINSPLGIQITEEFLKQTKCIPLYFHENNLKDFYIKRAELLELLLTAKGYKIDYEFTDRPVDRKKIRVGILAQHFKPVSETYAYLPVYEHLSRDFEVILYSTKPTGHRLEQYCQLCANSFKFLPEDLSAQIETIREDDLDILFIASNVTAVTNDIFILATHRLARIHITSGGSVVTTGMRNMDYFISGTLTDPSPNAQEHYQEKLIKLEGSAHCFSYGSEEGKITTPVERDNLGIPEDAVVFISGANYFKIIPELIETWVKIIDQVPNSVLVLFPFGPNWSPNYPKQKFINYLQTTFTKNNLATARLIVLDPQPVPDREDMKEYYKIADVYLDSFPFAGTTSLVEPLQVNLPVITKQGNYFRSAMGAAMIQTLNIPGLVADSEESYIELAVALGNNPQLRQQKIDEIQAAMNNHPSFLHSSAYSAKMESVFKELFRNNLAETLEQNLRLRDINFIIFPDWTQPEDELGFELQQVIQTLATHPENEKITLIIYTANIASEDAEIFLSSVAMNLLMEDLDISDTIEISLVDTLGNMQWQSLLPRLNGRIILGHEEKIAIVQTQIRALNSYQLDSLVN
ncbi:glycosyltransferase [Anabaena azotica]|uniref:glycosyltransferase n=1 Tax=Anabaena azotica TaxID=197653 RepID=UPI0039A578EB